MDVPACSARLALLAALVLLSACAAPPPILDLSGHVCTPAPDLITATPVALGDPARPSPVKLTVDDTARCLETAQGKSLYGAFTLPTDAVPFMIAVRSVPIGEGLFVPRLLLLDGTGALQREVDSDILQFRGDTLTALIRAHPGERYLVVASTPQSVGQMNTRVVERTSGFISTTSTGAIFSVHSGSDEAHTFVYAHGGIISVYAASIPTAETQH